MTLNERQHLIKEVEAMPLGSLAKLVVRGSYVPGVHDSVLVNRCSRVKKKNLLPMGIVVAGVCVGLLLLLGVRFVW